MTKTARQNELDKLALLREALRRLRSDIPTLGDDTEGYSKLLKINAMLLDIVRRERQLMLKEQTQTLRDLIDD